MEKPITILNGIWDYKIPGQNNWRKMRIPSNWEIGGLKNHQGKALFRKTFFTKYLEALNGEFWLRFQGVDYNSRIWLNGEILGTHTGYFQPFEFRVTNILQNGRNVLEVEVDSCPERKKDWTENKRHIKGVFGHHDIRPGSWHPKYGQSHSTGGIWDTVEIIETGKTRINNICITSKLSNNYSLAKIYIKANLQANNKVQTIKKQLTIHNPKLWWTWDQGAPHLYTKIINLEGLHCKITFGIREVRLDKNQNLYLNGRKIFIRGSNIIPEEYLSLYTKKRIEKDIQLAKNANLNALRMHAHVNRKEFYDACDRAGILIWQDFPLQWEYTNNNSFIKDAKRQIIDMVNFLRNHPSIFFWCCHNEPIKSRNKLDPMLYKTVLQIDKSRPVIMNSDFKEHPYPGWFMGKTEYFVSLPGKPLVTEFGAQALPVLSTLKKIFSKKDLWPPNWQKWSYHNFVYEPTFLTAGINKGNSIQEFINNSQDYQSRLTKFAIEHYRSQKFSQISGLFHFLFVEPWPCISYSVLDYYRKPKKAYWALRESYQPLTLIYLPERQAFTIGDSLRGMFYLVNDYPHEFKNVTLKIKLGNFKYPLKKINIAPNSCIIANKMAYPLPLPNKLKEGEYKLSIELSKSGKALSQNTYKVKLKRIPNGLMEYNAVFDWASYF